MRRRIPTVEEAIPRALVGLAPNSRDLYAYYLRLLAQRHGNRKIDQLVVSDFTELGVWAQAMAVRRRSSASGASAREHAIAACRRLFDMAIADGYLQHNPAKAVRKPPRAESRRTALTDDQIAEIFRTVRDEETGLLRFLLETACRREGLLSLTAEKRRPARQTVLLDEKGSQIREQPVSQLMMEYLQQPTCPIDHWTRRRLDSLWLRIRRELAWADEISLSTHWFRHTTITNVERVTDHPSSPPPSRDTSSADSAPPRPTSPPTAWPMWPGHSPKSSEAPTRRSRPIKDTIGSVQLTADLGW